MAGMGTRDIKRKIKSVNNTKQITKAMELVSTAKLKRNKDRMDVTKPYFETVIETVQSIIRNEKSLKHEFINKREVRKSLYIVITADRGLCGGYNINAMKKAIGEMTNKENSLVITIGRKAKGFFNKHEFEIVKSFEGISEAPQFGDAQEIARTAMQLYKHEDVDEIKLVYSRLISTISQEPTVLKLLPIEAEAKVENDDEDFEFINYQPSAEEVLSYVIPKYIDSTIFGGLIESAAAEQAARRVAMESASDNAEDMIDKLTLSFNQARQSAITQEISEICGGAEALK